MLFLFHGSDSYRLKEAVMAVVSRHRQEGGPGPLTFDLSLPENAPQLYQAIATPSFFAERRLLVAHEPLAVQDIAEHLQESGAKDAGVDVLLIQPTGSKLAAGPGRELAHLERMADQATRYEPLTGADAIRWMQQFCSTRDRTITDAAAQQLLRLTAGDGWETALELEKLCAYVDSDITAEAVRELVAQPPSVDQWELSNALAGRDKRRALAALWRKVQEGTPEPLLAGTVAASLRTLLMVKDLAGKGHPAAAIAKTAGLHPFVVSKNLQGAGTYASAVLRTAHSAVAVLDRKAKTGQADAIDGLFSILLNL